MSSILLHFLRTRGEWRGVDCEINPRPPISELSLGRILALPDNENYMSGFRVNQAVDFVL